MSLILNEDQRMLQESVRDFCRDHAPVDVLRRMRDTRDPLGYPPELWKQMTELGWAGMTIPESYGGFEFGFNGLGIVLEETGRTLVPSPLVATVLLGATAVLHGGSEEQKQTILPSVVDGSLKLALAAEEGTLHNPVRVETRAENEGSSYRINGQKEFVLDGQIADKLVVVCRSTGEIESRSGISLFLVNREAPGVFVQPLSMVDSRNAARISFTDVMVSADEMLGHVDRGYEVLEPVLDAGRIGLAAEMLGSMQEVFDRIVEYLKERSQFGVPIGAFQALQHRAAEMYSEIELCRSLVREALNALDGEPQRVPMLASMVKAKASEAFHTVSNEGIQMHGGIGMTDEFDIGFYLKRARVVQQCLGDAAFHRDRYAALNGF